jgi:hypothetical protein
VAEDHHGGSETGLDKPLPQPPKTKPPTHLWQPAETQTDGSRTNEGYNDDWDAERMHDTDDNDKSDDETRAVLQQKPAPQQPKGPPPAHMLTRKRSRSRKISTTEAKQPQRDQIDRKEPLTSHKDEGDVKTRTLLKPKLSPRQPTPPPPAYLLDPMVSDDEEIPPSKKKRQQRGLGLIVSGRGSDSWEKLPSSAGEQLVLHVRKAASFF